jgi:F0F1-type ATP synthase membrane subunit c/vacuolar-type H+-ATPase subunit K
MGESLSQLLEPIASQFRSLNLPEVLTHWGHPFFMSIVMFAMGGYGAYAGWKGRLLMATDLDAAMQNKTDHKKIMPAMFAFMAIGATGGILSLVIQKHAVMESSHFLTAIAVLSLLFINGLISGTGFGGNNPGLRKAHAYLGSGILVLMIVHGLMGLKLGLSF